MKQQQRVGQFPCHDEKDVQFDGTGLLSKSSGTSVSLPSASVHDQSDNLCKFNVLLCNNVIQSSLPGFLYGTEPDKQTTGSIDIEDRSAGVAIR